MSGVIVLPEIGTLPSIWMIIRSFHPFVGGAERQAQGLSEHLLDLGWPVCVLTRRHFGNWGYSGEVKQTVNGVSVRRVFSRGPGPLGAVLFVLCGFWLLLHHGRNGVYFAHGVGSPAWLAVVARYLLGGRCVVKIRSEEAAYSRSWWQRVQLSWLPKLVDVFWVISDESQRILEQYGVAADKILLIPNGVDSDKFHPVGSHEKLIARQRLGLPVDKTIVLCVGRLIPRKAYDVLIEACAELPHETLSGLQIVIVGGGPQEESLKELARAKGMSKHLWFEGHQDETADYYKAADVFILQSRGEGLSNALIEAMSCGLPVICSAVGGAPDWIEHGINGFLFPSEDIERLREAITEMIRRREEWRRMGGYSRQLVEKELALSVTSRRFSEWLCRVNGRSPVAG